MLQFKPLAEVSPHSDGLPELVDRAARALSNARSSAEVLEARDTASFAYDIAKKTARMAQAKGAHDTLVAAAHRAQADALLIESQAKRRLADEYDAAQERGEISSKPGPISSGSELSRAMDAVPKKEIHDARRVRDAEEREPGIVARTVEAALDRGEEPTRAAVNRAIAGPSDYLNARAAEDEAKSNDVLDQRDFRALRKLWKSSRPGARALFREFIKGEK